MENYSVTDHAGRFLFQHHIQTLFVHNTVQQECSPHATCTDILCHYMLFLQFSPLDPELHITQHSQLSTSNKKQHICYQSFYRSVVITALRGKIPG